MAQETEYRFLLRSLPPLDGARKSSIAQGYLSTTPGRVVRVRRKGSKAFLTIKGLKTGATAPEFEYKIPVQDAEFLLALCGDQCLTKDRYEVTGPDDFIWEVDVFTGRHAGLLIAEIEVPAEGTAFVRPDWLDGTDVTRDPEFGNASLVLLPDARIREMVASARVK